MPQTPRTDVDIPFVGGYKQRDVPAWLDPTSQTEAVNAIWTKREAIEKRPGYSTATLSTGVPINFASFAPATLAADSFLIPQASGVCVTDGTYVYNADVVAEAQLVDFVSPCVVTRLSVSSSERKVVNPDVAEYTAKSLRIYVWQDSVDTNTTIFFALVDSAKRTVVDSGIVDKNNLGVNPKVMVLDGYAYVFWHDTSANAIYVASMSLVTAIVPGGSWTTSTLLTVAGSSQYDVAPSDNSAHMAIVYETTGGGSHLFVNEYTAAAGALSLNWSNNIPSTVGTGYRSVGIRYDGTNNRIWTAYGEAGGADKTVRYMTFIANNGTQLITPVVVHGNTGNFVEQLGIETLNATTAMVLLGGVSSSLAFVGWAVVQNTGNTGAVIQAPIITPNVQPLSRPFAVASTDTVYGARVYGWAGTANVQMSNVLVEYDVNGVEQAPRPCAVSCPRTAFIGNTTATTGIRRNRCSLSSVTSIGNHAASTFTAAGTLALNQIESDVVNAALVGAVDMTADFAHPGRFKSAQLAGLVYTGGGLPGSFDGVTMAEAGTVSEPCSQSPLCTAVDAGAGALIAGQTYSWVFVYGWRDRTGAIHRGQPSAPKSHTIGGSNQKVDLTIPSIYVTKQGTEWRRAVFGDAEMVIEVYRTYYDGSAMSTTFFLAGSVENDVSSSTTAFQDNVTDSSLIAASTVLPLYTTGGVLENDMPSSFADTTVHNSRIYGIGDDLRTVWLSTEADPTSTTPVRFNDGLQLGVGGLGDLTALWSMDDKLYLASATAIGYVSGGGPNNVGAQSDLSPLSILPTDVGVIDCRAVCVTQIGTIFRHRQGLGLLERSLSVRSDFGDPVIDLLTAYPNVTGMTLHPTRPEVLIAADNGTTGIVLVYNYRFDRWSQWSIYDLDNAQFGVITHSIAQANGTLFMGTKPGRVLHEKAPSDATPFYDATGVSKQWVTLTVSSAWVKPGGLQGQGRVDEFDTLFQVLDWANVSVSVSYDYSTSWVSPSTWTIPADQIAAFSDVVSTLGSVSRMEWKPPTAQCSGFAVRWTDAPAFGGVNNSSTGQAFRLLGMSATISNSGGLRRLPAAQGA